MSAVELTESHWSFKDMGPLLENFEWPLGEFEPEGAWRNEYVVGLLSYNPTGKFATPVGAMTIDRQPGPDGESIVLEVVRSAKVNWQSELTTTARIVCANDKLATPRSWTVKTDIIGDRETPMPGLDTEESGRLDGKSIVRTTGKTRTMKAGDRVTSNWSMFDAVQRLRERRWRALKFDLLEDLDMLRPNQELRTIGEIEVDTGRGKAVLHGYRQVGEGILPSYYWVDETGRLLFAMAGLRVYLLK